MRDLQVLYRQVIMDHYKHPRNKGLLSDETYKTVHIKNPSCGDDIDENLDGSWECIGCEFVTRVEPIHLEGRDTQVEDIWTEGLKGYYEND